MITLSNIKKLINHLYNKHVCICRCTGMLLQYTSKGKRYIDLTSRY